MSLAKITLTGQEIWLNHNNKSLFDLFELPEDIDKDNCIDNIMMECGELETLYSDPEFMRAAIGTWSKKHYWTFEKWANALKIEYSPLENYDRFEDWWDYSEKDNDNTRTLDHQDKRTLDTQDEETRDISDQTTYDKTTGTVNEVSAFDSSSYQPADQSTMDEDGTVTVDGTGTDTFAHTGTDTVDYSGTIKDEGGETVNSSHGGRIHGNVGVTTSQQMLQAELDIARFNLINQITDLFLTELCICVYE